MALFFESIRKVRSNLKMRSQILLINAFIFTVALSMLLIAQILNMRQSLSILNISSQNLMINELLNLLNTASIQIENQILFFYTRSQTTLTKLNILNQIVYKTDYHSNVIPQLCPYNTTFFDPNHYYPLACIIYHSLNDDTSQINTIQDYQLRNLTHLFNEMILSIDLTGQYIPNDLFMVSDSNQYEFAFYYPQWVKYQTFRPKQRQWYKQHFINLQLNPNNHTQLSNIYKYFNDSDVYSMTMTQSFFNATKQVDGLFASDIQLQNGYFNSNNLNMMIVNYDGKLILSNYRNYLLANSTKYESFYDENKTGFNISDWNAILNFINYNQKESTCQSIYNSQKQLCLYNSAYQQDVFISAKQIKGLNYYLIIFNNIQDQAALIEMLNQLIDRIYSQFRNQMIIIGLTCCLFTLISSLLVYYICRPMLKLIKLSNIYINQHQVSKSLKDQQFKRIWNNQEKFNNFLKNQVLNHNPQKTSNNLMIQLIQTFQKLFDRVFDQQNKKSDQCFILQSFNYPKDEHRDLKITQYIDKFYFESQDQDKVNLFFIYILQQLKRQFSL